MSYQVLARKWRPMTFAELSGQAHVVTALANSLERGRLHHAYLLTGTRGVGKTTIARILAKSLNCATGVTATPCGVCAACTDIDAGRFVDLLELDAASHTGIDNMREILDNARYAPTVGRYKVYLIDEVHMLSKQAFNSMLKTLEEPPEHVKFVLATTDPQKIPVTVLSRCLQFSLKPLTPAQIEARIDHILREEGVEHEPAAVALLARAAHGSLRDGLSLLDQAIAFGGGEVREESRAHHARRGRSRLRVPDRRRAGGRRRRRAARRMRRAGRARPGVRVGAGGTRRLVSPDRGGAGGAGGRRGVRRRGAHGRLRRRPSRPRSVQLDYQIATQGRERPRAGAGRGDRLRDDAAAHARLSAGRRVGAHGAGVDRHVCRRPRARDRPMPRRSRAPARARRHADAARHVRPVHRRSPRWRRRGCRRPRTPAADAAANQAAAAARAPAPGRASSPD